MSQWVELFDLVPDGPSDPMTSLRAVVMIALGSDRQARDDDALPDGIHDRSGWWADPDFGARLWLLRREALTDAVVIRAKELATEALQVLVDDGICQSFAVETARSGDALGMTVTLYRDGQPPALVQFDDLWSEIGG